MYNGYLRYASTLRQGKSSTDHALLGTLHGRGKTGIQITIENSFAEVNGIETSKDREEG